MPREGSPAETWRQGGGPGTKNHIKGRGEPEKAPDAPERRNVMKTIIGNGINYEVTGKREEEAAVMLSEGLDAISKRRNAYIDDTIDVVLRSVREYGVDVRAVAR